MSQYENTCLIRGDGGRTLRTVLDRIANKWTLLVVATIDQSVLRFSELQARIPGISQRMLTLTLRNLEHDGLVSRTAHAEVPPRVEYTLTATGKSLIAPALALAGWAREHVPEIEKHRTDQTEKHEGQLEKHEGRAEKHDGRAEKHEGRLKTHEGQLDKHEGQLERHTGQAAKRTGHIAQHAGRSEKHDVGEEQR
ncbi:hypothetical protein JCM9957A_72440 [Kineosporia succinea]|uniref:DNA-binding HxlR family transcriptional regulator n=1 Tax=Kineosporia succinea TaxID=84632 RepID=A0ABT9PEU8_9ACTN|nr:helix-turn-helix domain-containing protein [Kineosporia succinea]MDP9831235.1 DNA-binding HxlR family transcriptional regulator [Kineosporia succinea]